MTADELRGYLKRWWGYDDFRPGQIEIVEAAMEGRDTLAIMPTGGGKSLTYQLPAMLLPGATLILSPLIALMKDQAENLPAEIAPQAALINSSLDYSEIGRRLAAVKSGRLKMIYAAPERLRQPPFLHALRSAGIAMVVIDEAHCISQWGHDFRPDYRAVGKAIAWLNPRSVLAVTATATPDVQNDIEAQLGRKVEMSVRPTFRDNLFFGCHKVQGEDEKLQLTLEICKNTPGAGLVYATSREKCEQISRMLKRYGIAAGFYHAGLPPEERAAAQDKFKSGEVRVMAATVAFGMGVDKSDIRFLVHFHPSRTLENYYQEAGRAGRDGKPSQCILLYSTADASNANRYMRDDTLDFEDVKAAYGVVRQLIGSRRIAPVSWEMLLEAVGGEEGKIRSTLPLLEEAGLIARHTDIPQTFSVYPDAGEILEFNDDAEVLMRAVGGGGQFDSVELSQRSGIPLTELEERILQAQDYGYLTYRASPRLLLLELLPPPPNVKLQLQETLAKRQGGAKRRVEAMLDYARLNKCRHGTVARYFGERWANVPCGSCDVCTGEKIESPKQASVRAAERGVGSGTPLDPNEAPLVALKVVSELAQGYRPFYIGKTGLMRTLRGTPDAPVRPDRISVFGILASFKKAEVERLIDALVDKEYLRRDDEDEFRRLYLTEEGKQALQSGEVYVEWRLSAGGGGGSARGERLPKGGVVAAADLSEDDKPLYETLREWRSQEATEMNAPPYVVFADKVLISLAAHRPKNEFDLLEIPGIGPAKAARYGDTVLGLIRAFKAEHG